MSRRYPETAPGGHRKLYAWCSVCADFITCMSGYWNWTHVFEELNDHKPVVTHGTVFESVDEVRVKLGPRQA